MPDSYMPSLECDLLPDIQLKLNRQLGETDEFVVDIALIDIAVCELFNIVFDRLI